MIRLYGLVGYPLDHSWSAKYFGKKFTEEGIKNHDYQLFPLSDINDLNQLIETHPGLKGLNVTIPYKETVIHLLDKLSPEAEKSGAVNTILIERNSRGIYLTGFNTDIVGFRQSLVPHLEDHHTSAIILGTGGSAKAASFVLEELGIDFIMVSRNPKGPQQIAYPKLTPNLIMNTGIIINCTPVGMKRFPGIPPIPYSSITPHHLMFDVIYNPEETEFIKKGRLTGAKTISGLSMFHAQAEAAWKIWNT